MDQTVRIPPEMMPSEDRALHYFEYFFTNIHPYCPVINKAYFYQQWQNARDSISPLMLEAIYACSTLMLGDVEEGSKWLALATSQSSFWYPIINRTKLTARRTRGKFQRRVTTQHNAGHGPASKSSRGFA